MFPIEPKDLPCSPSYAPPPTSTNQIHIGQSWSCSDWVHTDQIQTRFKHDLNQMRTRSKWIQPNGPGSTNITSQLFAVCLAACKYQHRKWCHSGDAVNPVWTPALWRRRVETGSETAPHHYSLHCLCSINGLSWSFVLLLRSWSDYLWRDTTLQKHPSE